MMTNCYIIRRAVFWLLLALFIYAPPFASVLRAQAPVDVVRAVKAGLVARNYEFHLVPDTDPDGSEDSRCGAFAITGRAAYQLAQRGYSVFLIAKSPGQNGCTYAGQRYSHDAIVVNGQCVDILFRSETRNEPAWNLCEQTPEPTTWRPPFPLDSENPAPPPPPIVIPPAPPHVQIVDLSGLEAQLVALDAKLDQHIAQEEAHWAKVKGIWDGIMKPALTFVGKYGVPALVAFLAGAKTQ